MYSGIPHGTTFERPQQLYCAEVTIPSYSVFQVVCLSNFTVTHFGLQILVFCCSLGNSAFRMKIPDCEHEN